ncbi:MAG: hypothetical protein WAK95_21595 [Desulfobacterales bacterium]
MFVIGKNGGAKKEGPKTKHLKKISQAGGFIMELSTGIRIILYCFVPIAFHLADQYFGAQMGNKIRRHSATIQKKSAMWRQ